MVTPESLQSRLGYQFGDPGRLTLALTHRSWCAEHPGEPSNERLEFLGDAVLGLIVTDHIFERFPELPEGQLAKTRAAVVSSASLAVVGRSLRLGEELRLGRGEEVSGGRSKPSILADAVEAIIGAIHIDGGFAPASEFVLTQLADQIGEAALRPGAGDYKTQLQEMAAGAGFQPPRYDVTSTGPEHNKLFHATVQIHGGLAGSGEGRSKKEAEQRAARDALKASKSKDGE